MQFFQWIDERTVHTIWFAVLPCHFKGNYREQRLDKDANSLKTLRIDDIYKIPAYAKSKEPSGDRFPMSELTLEWSENGQFHRYSFQAHQATKQPGVFRIGRDPAQCDLVLHDRSVSALHVELFLNHPQQTAGIRNLRSSNPALVDGRHLIVGDAPLRQGSRISLGRVDLSVIALRFTISEPTPAQAYGLKCPNAACGKVSDYNSDILQQGCPWCGFSLAAANSVVIFPS